MLPRIVGGRNGTVQHSSGQGGQLLTTITARWRWNIRHWLDGISKLGESVPAHRSLAQEERPFKTSISLRKPSLGLV
jgi:hypothetical protein